MKVNGLTVDAAKIGQGLYEIICEKGEEAIVAFGMIPKWAMDLAEVAVREKIIAITCAQLGEPLFPVTPEQLKPYIDEQLLKDTVNPIMHQIGIEIYNAAAKAGRMVV